LDSRNNFYHVYQSCFWWTLYLITIYNALILQKMTN